MQRPTALCGMGEYQDPFHPPCMCCSESHRPFRAAHLRGTEEVFLSTNLLPVAAHQWLFSETAMRSMSRRNEFRTTSIRQASCALYGPSKKETAIVYEIPLDRSIVVRSCLPNGRDSFLINGNELYVPRNSTLEQVFHSWHSHIGYREMHQFPALQRAAQAMEASDLQEEPCVTTVLPLNFTAETLMGQEAGSSPFPQEMGMYNMYQAYEMECNLRGEYNVVRDVACPSVSWSEAGSLQDLKNVSILTQVSKVAREELRRVMPRLYTRLQRVSESSPTEGQACDEATFEACLVELEAHHLQPGTWTLSHLDHGGGADGLGLSLLFVFVFGRWLGARVRLFLNLAQRTSLVGVWDGTRFVPIDVTRSRRSIFQIAPKLLPFVESGTELEMRAGMLVEVYNGHRWDPGIVTNYQEESHHLNVRDLNTRQISKIHLRHNHWRRTVPEDSNLEKAVVKLFTKVGKLASSSSGISIPTTTGFV